MLEVNPSEMGGDALTGQTYGEMLKNAREAQGMSVEEAASKLRLSNKQIIGIENCEPEVFATTVYARGHLKRYAHLLQLDENQVIGAFNRTLSKTDKKLQSFITKSSSVPVTSQSRQSQSKKGGKQKGGWGKIIFILLIILVCILAWLYVQKGFFADSADDGYNRITEQAPEEQLGSEPVFEAPIEEIAKEDAAAETAAHTDQVDNEPVAEDDAVADIINRQEQQEQEAQEQEQQEQQESEQMAAEAASEETPAAEPAAEEAPAATEEANTNDLLSVRKTNSGFQVTVGTNRAKECTMIFEARNGDCWFGIYKDDQLAGAASLKDGQNRTLTYTLPVKISMGNPVAAKVQLNGQQVDLSRAQRLGITNFTVLAK